MMRITKIVFSSSFFFEIFYKYCLLSVTRNAIVLYYGKTFLSFLSSITINRAKVFQKYFISTFSLVYILSMQTEVNTLVFKLNMRVLFSLFAVIDNIWLWFLFTSRKCNDLDFIKSFKVLLQRTNLHLVFFFQQK